MERCILVLGALRDGAIAGVQPGAGNWRLIEAPSIEAAENVLAHEKHVRVGVWLYTGELSGDDLDRFGRLRARHRLIQWLALLPPDLPTESGLAEFIVHHFFDYLTLPLDSQQLSACAGHAYGMSLVLERATGASPSPNEEEQMVGTSEPMRELFRDIRKVAASDAPVFISGESGTGKELAANAIHERSSRAKRPFVAVDCGAIAPTLIHSELFGYERGAFTGAAQRKVGRIEVAEGGTLFLDEIGDLPLDLQGSLLRFLQESTIQRVGGTTPISVNVRVIAATHLDLDEAVKEGRFREDLYYRLNVLRLSVPALRERLGDVDLLARFFLAQFVKDTRKNVRGYTTHALDVMRQHSWPGNVRELINRVRRAIIMCDGSWITPPDLDLERRTSQKIQTVQLDAARELAERQAIHQAIKVCSNNYSAAARLLGVSRVTLYRLVGKHQLTASARAQS